MSVKTAKKLTQCLRLRSFSGCLYKKRCTFIAVLPVMSEWPDSIENEIELYLNVTSDRKEAILSIQTQMDSRQTNKQTIESECVDIDTHRINIKACRHKIIC